MRFELVAQVWLKYCAPLFYIWFCNILAFNKVMTIDEQVKLNWHSSETVRPVNKGKDLYLYLCVNNALFHLRPLFGFEAWSNESVSLRQHSTLVSKLYFWGDIGVPCHFELETALSIQVRYHVKLLVISYSQGLRRRVWYIILVLRV